MSLSAQCDEAREWIGVDPTAASEPLPAPIAQHVASCAECQRFAQEMRSLDGAIHRAMAVPLAAFRTAAAPAPVTVGALTVQRVAQRRYWAMAASVLLAVGAGIALWAVRSESTLAAAVVAHMSEEPASWRQTAVIGQTAIDEVITASGLRVRGSLAPVVYAQSCRVRGHLVPHLVVSTNDGPVTVLLLRDETVRRAEDFSDSGYRGVIWPAPGGHGAIAVLARSPANAQLAARAQSVAAAIDWSVR